MIHSVNHDGNENRLSALQSAFFTIIILHAFVCPHLKQSDSSSIAVVTFSATCLASMKPFGTAVGAKIVYLHYENLCNYSIYFRIVIDYANIFPSITLMPLDLTTGRRRESGDRRYRHLPLFEIRIDHSVRETLSTDTNTLKHTVTCKLVHYQVRIDES